jgi:hypothetical protein
VRALKAFHHRGINKAQIALEINWCLSGQPMWSSVMESIEEKPALRLSQTVIFRSDLKDVKVIQTAAQGAREQ